ncbi:MAG TPA: CAP domain-containing protein, partial [Opitutaceae bacterium]
MRLSSSFFCLFGLALAAFSTAFAQPSALTVDISSREEVRQFYRAVYFASENVPMGWTGSYALRAGLPDFGDTSPAFKEATRLRINFYRALVGVPADIRFDNEYNVKAQQAALMVSANNELNHFPPATWTFYTADGAEAAGKSNLAVGYSGPRAIDGYIADAGPSNAVVGHRRWLSYPQTLRMGTGDVPGSGLNRPAANAVWII